MILSKIIQAFLLLAFFAGVVLVVVMVLCVTVYRAPAAWMKYRRDQGDQGVESKKNPGPWSK